MFFWGGTEERVLDPSPSPGSVSVLGNSTGQVGVPQEEVLDPSPSFSPLPFRGLYYPLNHHRLFQ